MRYAQWSFSDWAGYAIRVQTPNALLSRSAGTAVKYIYIDTADSERLQNSVAERCDFVSGLALTASALSWVGRSKSLAIIGCGPTALISTSLALLQGIPVVHLQFDGTRIMQPLAGCPHRWICPDFYHQSLLPSGLEAKWEWKLPSAFQRGPAAPEVEEIMAEYYYGHEAAKDIAKRWTQIWAEILQTNLTAYARKIVLRDDVKRDHFSALHRAITGAELEMGISVGAVLHCRFLDSETLTVPEDGMGPPAFTSFPYWEYREREPWFDDTTSLLISGSGDAAIQDFLRAVWDWTSLQEGAEKYLMCIWKANLYEFIISLDTKYETLRTEMVNQFSKIDDDRLKWLEESIPLKTIDREVRTRQKNVRAAVQGIVLEDVNFAVSEIDVEHAPVLRRTVYLHTRSKVLGTYYLHNLFFGLFTIEVLKKTGVECWISDKDLELNLHNGQSVSRDDPLDCSNHARKGHLSAAGIAGLGDVLLRYGPRRLDFHGEH